MGKQYFDVAVVGAGPAGAAAALTLLQRTSYRVALIDKGFESFKPGEHLTPGAKPLLHFLGIDLDRSEACRRSFYVRTAWGGDTLFERHYLTSSQGPAWMLDRQRFDPYMVSEVNAHGGTLILPGRISRVSKEDDASWTLGITTPEGKIEVHAAQIIDATGRPAMLARRAGAARKQLDHLVGWIRHSRDPVDTADAPGPLIEARPYGWWYSTPLPDGRVLAALMVDADLTEASSTAAKIDLWNDRFGDTIHTRGQWQAVRWQERLDIRAAHSQLMTPACGPGWVASGDAAMALDPLSSSGISYALFTGIHAARLTAARLLKGNALKTRYGDELARIFTDYLRERHQFYAAEIRWPHEPFWRRRHEWPGSA